MKRDEFDEKFEKYAKMKNSSDFDPLAEIYNPVRKGAPNYSALVSQSCVIKIILESFLSSWNARIKNAAKIMQISEF